MKKLSMQAIMFFALLTALSGCEKGKKDVQLSDAALLEQFFERNMVPTQNFTVDAGAGGVINTAGGTRITFPPNVLLTANGQPVTGTVNVEFKEIIDKADFVLSNKPTISDGLPLESGGTWLLEVKQNGQPLRIRAGNPAEGVRLNIKRDSAQQGNMQLFNATPKTNTNAVNWGPPRRPIIPLATPFANYFCNLDSVGWGNADVFMTNPDYAINTTVTANKRTTDLSNFSGMFIYKGRKTVWPLQKDGTIFLFRDSHIAKRQQGHFAVFGFVNGAFTAGILEDKTVMFDNETFDVLLTFTGPNAEANFKARLRQIL